MKINNKMFFSFFTVFLILLLSCGFVSAASDMGNSDSTYIDDSDTLSLSEDIIAIDSQYENEDIETEDYSNSLNVGKSKYASDSLSEPVSGNTFEDIQTAIDNANEGDTIELSGTYVGKGSCINITKNLIIDGNFETILDAKSKSGIFNVNSNNVIIKNLRFCNGNVTYYGGAINFLGNGSVINCTFTNNSAGGVYGSVDIFWSAGGTVYWSKGIGSVIDCTFINNVAKADGGAIYWDANNGSIVNCTFINNTANELGGAIYLGHGHDGGAYYSNVYNCSVIDCTFDNNHAGEGGAIYYSGSGNILNSSFNANGARFGSSICVNNLEYNVDLLNENLTVKECSFREDNGTAIINYKPFDRKPFRLCVIVDSSFSNTNNNKKFISNQGDLYLSGNRISSDYAGIKNWVDYHEARIVSPVNLVILDNTTQIADKNSSFDIYAKLVDDQGNIIEDKNISLFVGSQNKTAEFDNVSLFKYHFDNLNSFNSTTLISGDYVGVNDLKVMTGVISTIINPTIELDYLDDAVLVSLKNSDGTPISGESVSVNVNGVASELVTDDNGEAKVDVNDNSTVKAVYTDLSGSKATASLVVVVNEKEKLIPAIANATISLDANKNNSAVIVTLKDLSGDAIKNASLDVLINGTKKTITTNGSGQAKIDINGNATVEVSYTDANNANATASSKITIINTIINQTVVVPVIPNRNATKIIYNNMTTTAVAKVDGRVGEYFEVSLQDADGKALANKLVQIGFNGAVYNRTTNETGGVRLQINLGYEGKYTFAIAFLGDDNYTGDFQVALIEVTPHTPKLTAPAKTYKASAKTKTLTATFKSANGNAISGKKISFTINGKTYTATTNSKGVATVKISLNKKGTYSATAKYAGDGMYKATNTKFTVKIT